MMCSLVAVRPLIRSHAVPDVINEVINCWIDLLINQKALREKSEPELITGTV